MKIIIVGCGRVGSGLAQSLSQSGHAITVIDSDASAFRNLPSSFKGRTIEGIGFDRDVLDKAGIQRSDALAAFTSKDEANAVIARMAKEIYRVPKVVARLYERDKAEIYRRLGVQTISSTIWGIKRATDLLFYSQLDSIITLGSGEVDIVKIEVPSLMAGHTVGELSVVGEIKVVALERQNKTFLPTFGTVLQKQDVLYIAVVTASTDRLNRLLGLSDGKGM